MRSPLHLVLAPVAVLLAAPVVLAQPATTAPPRPGQAAAVAPAPARVPLSIARGVVKTVGDTRLVIDPGPPVNGQPAPPTSFVLDGQTLIQRLGRPLTPKDLRAGDSVTVGYQMRGTQPVASRVWLRFGPTAGAPTPGAAPAR
ncbi:MAG TPA: hypothetical protein VFC42_16165 [Methylomirabilota bacterium]|nr:hypothetical protein [Methylomirabilota bacterium]